MNKEINNLLLKKQSIFEGLSEIQMNRVCTLSKQYILHKKARLVITSLLSGKIYLLVQGKM
jgi:hypothetical protein